MIAEPCFRDRARHALICALVLGLSCGHPTIAANSTIGRTWPIAEPDAMAEIEARAAKAPSLASRLGPRSSWSALQAAPLAQAKVDRVRSLVPFYTVEEDIRLPDGRLLYPKGFTFNPLDYVSLPQRLVIVHPRDLGWALKQARFTDFILLTAGDALDLSERSGRPLFILEERVKERLGLSVAPVIVAQQGKKLVLTEYAPLRAAGGSARP
ncbi:putative cytosolic protein [Sphingobium herbicidovorans NBRC 16415]|uniref:Cytosolic protein n=1 Tax=Sphingobium herbicidovorans (strain ATCC 700291 / DSM 11019 / CCUG 56400 / KCTC 2939 / LMG 18315 / NBRC 16415 / MH) TaxID=1219045 RepID=A0A086P4U8_SPHHM|nr:conjugal transfer protein TraW [Sphingobium herbicidovorans]KFG88416.1 putative cytosolic protein [Sphingobium herbicidovorans NBRC 16415]